jgi:hypothetical protein
MHLQLEEIIIIVDHHLVEIVLEEEEEIEVDVILVHHLAHQFVVEDAILILVLDLPLVVILEEERDLTLVINVVSLVEEEVILVEDEAIPVEEAILVDVVTLVVKATLEV